MNIVQIKTDREFNQYGASQAPSLIELQNFVGGFIETVPVIYQGKKQVMVVNEDGKIDNLPLNEIATMIFLKSYPSSDDFIVGNVWIVESLE